MLLMIEEQQLYDQVKKPITITNNTIIITRVSLNFNLPIKEQKKIKQLVLKVYCLPEKGNEEENAISKKKQKKMSNIDNGIEDHEFLYELGQCKINGCTFMNEYQNNNIKQFHQICKLNEHMSLKFSLYLGKSRFSLERYIRKLRESLQNQDPKQTNQNRQLQDILLCNHLQQNKTSQNVHPRFISADKKIINDKKLIIRNSSSLKKSNCSASEEDKINHLVEQKFVEKNQINVQQHSNEMKNDKIKVSQTKKPVDMQTPSPKSEGKKKNGNNFLQVITTRKIQNEASKFQLNTSLRTTQKNQDVQQLSPRSPRSARSTKSQKSQKSFKSQKSHSFNNMNKIQEKSDLENSTTPQSNQIKNQKTILTRILHSKIFIILFIVVSTILLLNIMTPTKKVRN